MRRRGTRGRPRTPKETRLTEVFAVRFSEGHARVVREFCRDSNVIPSVWLRTLATTALVGEGYLQVEEIARLVEDETQEGGGSDHSRPFGAGRSELTQGGNNEKARR